MEESITQLVVSSNVQAPGLISSLLYLSHLLSHLCRASYHYMRSLYMTIIQVFL